MVYLFNAVKGYASAEKHMLRKLNVRRNHSSAYAASQRVFLALLKADLKRGAFTFSSQLLNRASESNLSAAHGVVSSTRLSSTRLSSTRLSSTRRLSKPAWWILPATTASGSSSSVQPAASTKEQQWPSCWMFGCPLLLLPSRRLLLRSHIANCRLRDNSDNCYIV